MAEPPIDFAIIAALKVEREAMVRRLDGMQKVQEDGEPLTYYTGTLAVPGEERPFTVVVTQLIEMGNPDAAITTTRVIQRWQPRNVLMVGIAGGVKAAGRLYVHGRRCRRAHFFRHPAERRNAVDHGQGYHEHLDFRQSNGHYRQSSRDQPFRRQSVPLQDHRWSEPNF